MPFHVWGCTGVTIATIATHLFLKPRFMHTVAKVKLTGSTGRTAVHKHLTSVMTHCSRMRFIVRVR